VLEELNRRYTHPESAACCKELVPGVNDSMIEYGTDTTRAIARILFSGSARRYRDIRWIFSHGGGTTPFLAERFVREPRRNPEIAQHFMDGGVMAELQRFYYDTAQVAHPIALAALSRFVPVSQILWGTDYPFRRGEEYVKALRDFGFTEEDLRKIERENALGLLPRWRAG
jgi:6-methylsalicylate decarboxylase